MDIEKQTETAIVLEADSETHKGNPNSGALRDIPVIPGNRGWYILSTFAVNALSFSALPLIVTRFPQTTTVPGGFLFIPCFCFTQYLLLVALCYAYRRALFQDVPRSRCELGRLAKSANLLISIGAALLAGRYLVDQHEPELEFVLRVFIVSLNVYVHAMIRFVCCIFLDLCLRDLLVTALMQILALQFSKTHAFICGVIILHDFCFYKPVPDIYVEERIEAAVLRLMDSIHPKLSRM